MLSSLLSRVACKWFDWIGYCKYMDRKIVFHNLLSVLIWPFLMKLYLEHSWLLLLVIVHVGILECRHTYLWQIFGLWSLVIQLLMCLLSVPGWLPPAQVIRRLFIFLLNFLALFITVSLHFESDTRVIFYHFIISLELSHEGAQAWDTVFVTELFTLSDPIWVGDLRTEPNNSYV